MNPETGRPVLREVVQYKTQRTELGSAFAEILNSSKSCGITSGDPLDTKEPITNGMFGGNIEGGPGGLCLLGNDHFAAGQYDEYAKTACRNSKAIVKVPTNFLSVGHVDEIVTTVRLPGKPEPCNFAVLVASPREGLAALRANPRAPSVQYSGVNDAETKTRMSGLPEEGLPSPFAAMCDAYEKKRKQMPVRPSTGKRSRSVSKFDFLITAAFAESRVDHSAAASDERCDQIPSGEMASAIQSDANLGPFNEAIQAEMDQFKKDYAEALKKANPTCGAPVFVDVPDLFQGKSVEKDGKIIAAEGDSWSGLSLYSNPTNNLQFGSTVVLPDPGNENFRNALAQKLTALGLSSKFIDTYFAHSLQGNLHCSTNAMRYCRPAGVHP